MLLRKNRSQLEEMAAALKEYLPVIKRALAKDTIDENLKEKLLCAWKMLLHLTLVLNRKDDEACDTIADVEEYLTFLEEEVLSQRQELSAFEEGLSQILLTFCSNMVTLGVCDPNFIGNCQEISIQVLKRSRISSTMHWS